MTQTIGEKVGHYLKDGDNFYKYSFKENKYPSSRTWTHRFLKNSNAFKK